MNIPSIKTLSQVFKDPKQARAILVMSHAELGQTPAGEARIRECFHRPKWYDVRLHCLNALESGLCGVEGFQLANGEYVEYLNSGETYAKTIVYFRGRYSVRDWGSLVERYG